MSKGAQKKLVKTSEIPYPNIYVKALLNEYKEWAFCEEKAPQYKGLWKKNIFKEEGKPLDLEIGTGNGTHFADYCKSHPERNLIGLELKYKPLIQTIRRTLKQKTLNGRVARYNAVLIDDIFSENEIHDVMIYFPDPWTKLSQQKHRLIQSEFVQTLFEIQKSGSKLYFKTDNLNYFNWCLEIFEASSYRLLAKTFDLHQSEYSEFNFRTAFENIFLREGLKINYCLLEKP